jgi:1,4-alpha-glucan branching enzyme
MKTAKLEKSIVAKKNNVQFRVSAPSGSLVYVAGTFNDWQPLGTPLKEGARGFATTLSLPPGRYEYKYVVNGEWLTDPDNADVVSNDAGSLNSVITV